MKNETEETARSELKEEVEDDLSKAAAIIDCIRALSETSSVPTCREGSISIALHHALCMIEKSKAVISDI